MTSARTRWIGLACLALGLCVFGLVVWARVPLLAVLLTIGPLACAWAWWVLGRQALAQNREPSA